MINKKGKIIAFSGLDGSGKTTQAKILEEMLLGRGKNAVRIKPFSYFLLALIVSIIKRKNNKKTGLPIPNPLLNYKKKFFLCSFLPLFAVVDHWLYFLVKIWPLCFKFDYVICDRYFYDFSPNYLEFGYGSLSLIKKCLKLLPQPDYAFLLNISPRESFRRKKEFNLAYLEGLNSHYQKVFEGMSNLIRLDAMIKQRRLSSLILKTILER